MPNLPASPHILLGGILMGGRSRRMGQPKGMLPFAGRTFVETIAERLGERVDEVVLLGSGLVARSVDRLRRIADPAASEEIAGPLAGVLAALRSEPAADWLIVACDQPLLSIESFDWLLAEARRSGAAAVLARRDSKRIEPFPGFYSRRLLPILESLAARGERSLQALAILAEISTPEIPSDLAGAWTSVDTPEAFAALLAPPQP